MRAYELGNAGYEEFGEADTGGGYDWSVFGVWLKDGVFYWASDSGCSCSGPWDYMNDFPADFEGSGNAHDAIYALHSWSAGQYTVDGSAALLAELLDYRPVKPAQGIQFGDGNVQISSF